MINSITVINYLGDSIYLDLREPEESGFLVESIEGLGPCTATINTSNLASGDGSVFNSAKVGERNIVLSLVFLQNDSSIEDLRQLSYKFFPIKKELTLVIETENRLCAITGHVESNEPYIFSSRVSTQISIICSDPYFYSCGIGGNKVTVFSGVEPLFEFPFEEESTFEISEIKTFTEQNVNYEGDSEIGIKIYIYALDEATNITIYNAANRETMKIDTTKLSELTGSGLIAGDEIDICTVKGSKSIVLLRSGIVTNILNCIDKDSDWFQLVKGDNIFAYTAETGKENLQFRIENNVIYEGV